MRLLLVFVSRASCLTPIPSTDEKEESVFFFSKLFDALKDIKNTLTELQRENQRLSQESQKAIDFNRKLFKDIQLRLNEVDYKTGVFHEEWKEDKNKAQKKGSDGFEKLHNEIKKHNLSLEDLIESLEEIRESPQSNIPPRTESQKREEILLQLLASYQEQLFHIQSLLSKNPDWTEQLAMIERKLRQDRQRAGIGIISETDIPVDYEMHDVISVIHTDDMSKDKMVSDIFTCGYTYYGKVLKKAKVSAWRGHAPKTKDPITQNQRGVSSDEAIPTPSSSSNEVNASSYQKVKQADEIATKEERSSSEDVSVIHIADNQLSDQQAEDKEIPGNIMRLSNNTTKSPEGGTSS